MRKLALLIVAIFALTASCPPSPTIASITVGFQGGSTTSATLNIGAATAGQLVWAAVSGDTGGIGGSFSVTDNCNTGGTSDAYITLGVSNGAAGLISYHAWSTIGANASPCTLTYTSTTGVDFTMAAGLANSATAVEQSQINFQTSPGTAPNAITSTPIAFATSNPDLVIGWYENTANAGAAIPTAGTGFTIQQTTASGPTATESLTQTSPGFVTATFTTTASGTAGTGFSGVICIH